MIDEPNAVTNPQHYHSPIHQPATVKIVSPDSESGFIVINASDFDASKHVAYTGP